MSTVHEMKPMSLIGFLKKAQTVLSSLSSISNKTVVIGNEAAGDFSSDNLTQRLGFDGISNNVCLSNVHCG